LPLLKFQPSYVQLTSVLKAVPPSATCGRAYRGDRDRLIMGRYGTSSIKSPPNTDPEGSLSYLPRGPVLRK